MRLPLLVVALLSAGWCGVLAGQAGERARELRRVRAELRARQTRRYGTVVVVKVMVGVRVRKRGVCGAFLLAQYLGAGLEAAMAAQAGEHGEVGQGARGHPGGESV